MEKEGNARGGGAGDDAKREGGMSDVCLPCERACEGGREGETGRSPALSIGAHTYSHATKTSVMTTKPPMMPEIELDCEDS